MNLIRGSVLGLLVVAAALPLPLAARGSRLSLPEIARAGERIVVGRVLSSSCRWGEGQKMIWTDYEVRVDEVWKGSAGGTLVVSVAGGRVGDRAIEVTHVPRLVVGATYVLALHGNEHLYGSPVVGSEQGAFREVVVEDDAGPSAVLASLDDALLSLAPDGGIVRRGRLEPTAGAGAMRRAPAAVAVVATRGLSAPVFRDGEGRIVTPAPARRLRGIEDSPGPPALTREVLREAVRQALRASAEVAR